MVLAVRRVCAIKIQRWFLNQVEFYRKVWKSINGFQALARGYIQRQCYKRMLQERPLPPRKRSLDAFTAVIRIQSMVRSTIIRKAYLHEHRLRFSYTDAQWNRKEEGVRSRIMALVPASHRASSPREGVHPCHTTGKPSRDGPNSTFVTPSKANVASAGPSPASLATAALTDLEATLNETRDLSSSTILAYCLDGGEDKSPVQPRILEEEDMYSPDTQVAFANESEDECDNDMKRISNPNSPFRSEREVFSPIDGCPDDEGNRWVDPEAFPRSWKQLRFDPSSSVATNKQGSQQETPPVSSEGNNSDERIYGAAAVERRFVTTPDDLLESAWDNRGNIDSFDEDDKLSDKKSLLQRSSKLKRLRGKLSASSHHDGTASVGSHVSHSSIRSRSSPAGQHGSTAGSQVLELHDSSGSSAPQRKDMPLSSSQASPTRSNVSSKEYEDPPLYMDMSDDDETSGSSPARAVRGTAGRPPVAGSASNQATRFASYVPSAQYKNSELQTIENQAIAYSNDIPMRRAGRPEANNSNRQRRSRHDSADTSNTTGSSVEEPFDVRRSAGVVEQTKNAADSADFFVRQQVDTAMEEFF